MLSKTCQLSSADQPGEAARDPANKFFHGDFPMNPLHLVASMHETSAPKLVKWPFLAGDLLLLAVAAGVVFQHSPPPGVAAGLLVVFCVALGAWLAVTPFLVEYRAQVKFAEANQLRSALDQIKNLQAVGGQISDATAQWQTVQELAAKSVSAAKEIGERMAAETKAFAEFMQKAKDAEKAQLRLEVEKLRRGEGEWLQAMVRLLDQVYALHQAAARSSPPGVAEQLGHFQRACRDLVRRLGLVPFEAREGESFDSQKHQLLESEAAPPANVRIRETVATGYHFQSQLVRRAVVNVKPAPAESETAADQDPMVQQLPLINESPLTKK